MEEHVLFLLLAASSMTDLKYRYIDNQLILFCMISGLGIRLVHGVTDPADLIAGVICPFLLLYPFYAMRLIGAGDVKLLMAAGVFTGLNGLKMSLIPVTVISVILTISMAIKEKKIRDLKIPMAIPISLGILISRL